MDGRPQSGQIQGAAKCRLYVSFDLRSGSRYVARTRKTPYSFSMIKGKTVHLRTIRQADLDRYIELESDVESRGEYVPHIIRSDFEMRKTFSEDGFWSEQRGVLLIVDKSDRILGVVVCFKPGPYIDGYEVGYMLFDTGDRGKGVATEATKLFVRYLFDAKNINRLQLAINVGNEASRRVAEKCGFKSEGVLRHAITHGARPTDLEIFSLLRHEAASLQP